jgi:transposase
MNTNFKGKQIFVGLDIHKKSCELKALSDNLSLGNVVKLSPYNGLIISNFLHKHYPDAKYLCVYEAGFSGFWLQRELSQFGINCIVVNPADVPTSNKDSVNKNDQIDAIKLGKSLRADQLRGIYIPSIEQEQARSLVRQRIRIKHSIKRFKNRIMSHYNFQGIQLDWDEGKMPTTWSRNKINQLEQDALKRSDLAMLGYLDTIKSLRQEELKSLKRIRHLSQTATHKRLYESLLKIRGIGSITAMIYITELMTMSRFKTFDKLQSFVGLIPTQQSSSETDKRGHMTNRSNGILKIALNQSAWSAVRYNPEMSLYYEEQKARLRKSQFAIIKVMVKLLRKIRYEWNKIEQEDYT